MIPYLIGMESLEGIFLNFDQYLGGDYGNSDQLQKRLKTVAKRGKPKPNEELPREILKIFRLFVPVAFGIRFYASNFKILINKIPLFITP